MPKVTKNDGSGYLPEDREPGNILDHLDKLEPSKGGKYYCPVCEGNDLSINKKSGAMRCWTGDCSWKAIMDIVAPLPDNGKRSKVKATSKFTTPQRKAESAIASEIAIDARILELVYEVESGGYTKVKAAVALAAWCKEHGHNNYTAQQLLKERLGQLREATGYDDDEMVPKLLRDYRKIEKVFGDRLRYNQLFKQVELDGQPFEPSMAKIEFVVDHNLKLSTGRDDIGDSVVKLAKQNTYHPVREYLEDCHRMYGDESRGILTGFADRYFGTNAEIHQIATIKFLISAVARTYQPGCQADNALILQGAQGVRKSSFFQCLASPAWFDDSFGNAGDKDERLKLHCAWILEWAELESVFKRKDISQIKAFMTTKIDRLRPPYGRAVEFMERSSIFCGTTNENNFLSDPTGHRRFWVIPVSKLIDTTQLGRERDLIWAAITALYKEGHSWDLTPEEKVIMDQSKRAFESSDVWEDTIGDWLEGRSICSITEILEGPLRIEINQQDRRSQLRVRDILMRLNWLPAENPRLHQGKKVRVWLSKEVLN